MLRSCARRVSARWPLQKTHISWRQLSSSAPLQEDSGMPNHYDTLDVSTTATAKEIKSAFYKLSKAYHPDLHPDDATASQRFVKISEAYAILGSAEKRQRYDRDFLHASPSAGAPHGAHYPSGSHSSASTGPGGRPASGLSRRRTQFRGPPPSFYRSGGWGQHGAKRAEHASKSSDTSETRGESASGPAGPGMGPGGFATGFDGDVPHFDNRAHTQTHSDIERRQRMRRRRQTQFEDANIASSGSSALFNFILLSGVLTVIMGISGVVHSPKDSGTRKRDTQTN